MGLYAFTIDGENQPAIACAADLNYDIAWLTVLKASDRAIAVRRNVKFQVTDEKLMEFTNRVARDNRLPNKP